MRTGRGRCVVALALGVSLLAGCAADPATKKRAAFEAGNKYFAEHKYNEAIVEYQNAIQADERFGEARFKLGEAFSVTNQPARALREYVRAADLMPQNVAAQLAAGRL